MESSGSPGLPDPIALAKLIGDIATGEGRY
jgi:hypothetical protein